MKRFSALIIAFVLFSNLYGQNDTAYIHTFGGIQDDFCKQVQPTPDGGYIMIGTTSSFGAGNTDFYAIKTDSLCNFKWSKCYGGPLNEEGFSVTTTLDKGFAFVGFTDSYGAGGYDVFLVKTDSMGNQKWQKTYGGSNWDFGYSIQQLKDSGYVICGLTYSYGSPNGSMYVIRTDKMGDTLWTKTVGDSAYTVGNAVYALNDSIYFIAGGTTAYGIGDTNACVVKIKDYHDSGHVLFNRVYGKQQNSTFNSISGTMDTGCVMYGSNDSVIGSSTGSSFSFECLDKIDSLGKVEWVQLLSHLVTAPEVGADAVQLGDGSILLLGSTSSFGAGGFDFDMQRIASDGSWIQAITIGGYKDELAGSIAVGKNGDLIFAGSSDSYPIYSCGLFDVFMVRFKSTYNLPPNTNDTVVYRYIDTTQFGAAIQSLQQNNVGVSVFPNPVCISTTILVQGSDFEKYTFNLFNIAGQKIITEYPLNNIGHGQAVARFQKDNLSSGEYMYEILSNGNTKVASGKLIIE